MTRTRRQSFESPVEVTTGRRAARACGVLRQGFYWHLAGEALTALQCESAPAKLLADSLWRPPAPTRPACCALLAVDAGRLRPYEDPADGMRGLEHTGTTSSTADLTITILR